MFKIDVKYTGSKGNVTIIDDSIMIDCGVAYKYVADVMPTIDKIFITHRHDDHLKLTALKQMYKRMPWKLENDIFMNEDTWNHAIEKVGDKIPIEQMKNGKNVLRTTSGEMVKNNIKDNITTTFTSSGREYSITTFELDHDVENQGFILTNDKNETLVYATDTSHLNYLPKSQYDYLVIEGNYDQQKMMEGLGSDDPNEVNRAVRNMRHLSIQDFIDIIYSHSHEDTEVYQLHESDTYGSNSEINHGKVRKLAKLTRDEVLEFLKENLDESEK